MEQASRVDPEFIASARLFLASPSHSQVSAATGIESYRRFDDGSVLVTHDAPSRDEVDRQARFDATLSDLLTWLKMNVELLGPLHIDHDQVEIYVSLVPVDGQAGVVVSPSHLRDLAGIGAQLSVDALGS